MPLSRVLAVGVGIVVLLVAWYYAIEADEESGRCVPVSGKVFFRGAPAAGAHVAFYPLTKGAPPNISTAVVEADGTFRLMTFKRHDGAPVGEYSVTVFWPDPSKSRSYPEKAPDLLEGRYRAATTMPLKVTFSKATELEPFELR